MEGKERKFIKLPYSELYVLQGEEPYPDVFVDDTNGMYYIFSHMGFEGPTYWGMKYE